MAAAPVLVSREVAKQGTASAIVVNSGCANACTGEQGLADARAMADIAANLLAVPANTVVIASTGIIGVNLPMDKVTAGITAAVGVLSTDGHDNAMRAIMTTDTFAKHCTYEFNIGETAAKIGGMAKGAGMIHPNMATMLCFITTDAAIAPAVLQHAITEAVNVSFNMAVVDGDTSTNDMVIVLANGAAGNPVIDTTAGDAYEEFAEALTAVCVYLAKQVVRDGEGATKFIEIEVSGAETFTAAKQAAMAVAKSPLVKTAFFGQDPNWGRILCAVGYSGAAVDPAKVSLAIGGITIVNDGLGAAYNQQALKAAMAEHDLKVEVNLARGTAAATVWTCDFSYDYVKINGEYHT
jgi:glutamate N-acetyltransferase/amino-acid N-acetyltransferase